MTRGPSARALAGAAIIAVVSLSCKIEETGRADSLVAGQEAAEARRNANEVRFAVSVARALRAHPDSAAAILESHRLTRAGLDSMLYDIAADPVLAAQYDRGIGARAGDELD